MLYPQDKQLKVNQLNNEMERVGGIEPPWPAWKAGALPLCYTRFQLVDDLYTLTIYQCKL